jgi:hypothetical protein
MFTDAPDHVIMRSLAHEIAFGGDVGVWAKLKIENPSVISHQRLRR